MADADDKEGLILAPKPTNRTRLAEFIIDQYKAAHPEEAVGGPTEPHKIAAWAIEHGLYDRPPMSPEQLLRRELSRFLKNDMMRDPQGRLVRKNHAVIIDVITPEGIQRRSRWYEIFQGPPDHMRGSFQLRRRGVVRDVIQLDLDFQSYNENNVFGAKLPAMDFNINVDLEESKQPGVYPTEPPEGLFDEEEEV